MRKLLIGVLLLFVCFWGFLFASKGVHSFITVYSLDEISARQKNVDDKITQVKNLQNETYKSKISKLSSSVKTYDEAKEQYDDLMVYATDTQKEEATLGNFYDIEYLWTKLGVYSTKYGTDIGLTVSKSDFGTSTSDYQMCDFNFTVTGTYINVTDYIYAMEDDTDLNFSIRDFKMVSASNNTVKASFTVESIPVSVEGLSSLSDGTEINITSSENSSSTGSSDSNESSKLDANSVKNEEADTVVKKR